MSTQFQLNRIFSKAKEILFSYDKFQELIKKHSPYLGSKEFHFDLEKVTLNPGWTQVTLKITISNKKSYQVIIGIERELVYCIRSII